MLVCPERCVLTSPHATLFRCYQDGGGQRKKGGEAVVLPSGGRGLYVAVGVGS